MPRLPILLIGPDLLKKILKDIELSPAEFNKLLE